MIFHPGILALLLNSGLNIVLMLYAAWAGIHIIRHWDIASGSERQLQLERKTYLIATVMSFIMAFQLLSLLLFVYTADTISSLFIGAMCAAGSLKVNGFGYPALLLKIVSCLAAGVWLIINHLDNKAPDYPLIRTKYRLLACLAPLLIGEALIQAAYIVNLEPNIITSCCGMLFSANAKNIAGMLLQIPVRLAQVLYYSSAACIILFGVLVYRTTRWAVGFGLFSAVHFCISILAVISFISIYIYELPTHHCPFCMLQSEYHYFGYPLYVALLAAAITGMGTAAIEFFKSAASLTQIVPRLQRSLALVSTGATVLFFLASLYMILTSNLSLQAY